MDIVIPNATSIGFFAVAAVLLLLTPGPAVLYIVARSVEQGRIAGLAAVAVRAHLHELAGDRMAAISHYRAAAGRTTSIPERNYLIAQAARLAGDRQ